jgi:NAD(P)-dependent dehydrogenase (short-subunit alcohol dehydrogenase family)
MKNFRGKVAVITGAASGIGRGLAERFAAEGMKVVLADIEPEALAQAEAEIKAQGATALAIRTDVSKAGDVKALAEKTMDAFGAVHVLCNNAGVINAADRPLWECTQAELEWVVGVNLWGVIHGVRIFVPIMLEQDTEGHIVNTASVGGLISSAHDAIYTMTKHGVVAISETIHLALANRESKVKVSVLCPGFINTRLVDAGRNRPAELDSMTECLDPEQKQRIRTMSQVLQQGMSPSQVADHVFKAIREEKFYVFTHPAEFRKDVKFRMENVLQERNPEA